LHVSVRTPDAGLTRGLREGLSDLVGRLEQSGYRAETWRPADNASTGQDQGRENPSQQHSSQQQNAGGSGTDSRQQQNSREQQQPGAHIPEWVGELESSLQRSNRTWLPSATR
jgi:TATA-binding protein-associated factor Taf7